MVYSNQQSELKRKQINCQVWEFCTKYRNLFERNIENKNLKMLPKWQEENPEHADMESQKSEEFMELSINALGGNNDKEVSEKKIMKNILKEVILKKEKHEKNNK